MKKIVIFILALIIAIPLYGADTAMDSFTDDSASPVSTDYVIGYSGTAGYRWTIASIIGLAPAVTLSGDPIAAIFSLSTQALSLDTQTANYVLAGPVSGAAAAPAFRALVSADIPNNAADTSGNAGTATALAANGANCNAGHAPLGVDASGAVESCFAVQPALDLLKGTYTNTYLCTYTTAGTLLDCNTNPASFVPATWIVQAGANNVLTYTGNFTFGVTLTGNTGVTFPTSGTLAVVSGALGTPSFTALNLPSSNADPSTTAGQIRHDSTVANHANGAVRWWDGTNIRQMVDMVAATAEGCTDTQVIAYNSTTDLFYCKDDANTGGTPTAITVADEAADTTSFPLFVTAATGDLGPKTDTAYTYNPVTGMLGVTGMTVGSGGVTVSKQSGAASRTYRYEANSTDTDYVGEIGPASMTGNTSYLLTDISAKASSANMVKACTNVGESGTGTPADPYIQACSWVDLDGYQTTVTEGSLADSVIVSADIKDGVIVAGDLATAEAAKLNRYHQTAHVDPNEVYSGHAGIIVLDPKTPAAITITEIAVYLDEDPTTELTITCYHKTAAIGYTGGTTIDANDTANGTFAATSSFDDATVPAGSKMWCVIGDDPDATNTDLEISITATYD